MEEQNQEYISIVFDLKPTKEISKSIINTIVLLLRSIADMEEYQKWDEVDTEIFNNNIEKIKRELDNLKIIKYESN